MIGSLLTIFPYIISFETIVQGNATYSNEKYNADTSNESLKNSDSSANHIVDDVGKDIDDTTKQCSTRENHSIRIRDKGISNPHNQNQDYQKYLHVRVVITYLQIYLKSKSSLTISTTLINPQTVLRKETSRFMILQYRPIHALGFERVLLSSACISSDFVHNVK